MGVNLFQYKTICIRWSSERSAVCKARTEESDRGWALPIWYPHLRKKAIIGAYRTNNPYSLQAVYAAVYSR